MSSKYARQLKYFKTPKGREALARKNAKRRRNLKWIKVADNPFSIEIDYHHIDDTFIFPIPRKLHMMCNGGKHRKLLIDWVKLFYPEHEIYHELSSHQQTLSEEH